MKHTTRIRVIFWFNYEDRLLRLLQGWIELTSCWLHNAKRTFSDVNDVTPLLIWLWGLLCDYYALLTSECKITTEFKHDYTNWMIDQSKSLPGFRVVTSLDGIYGYYCRRHFRECTVGTWERTEKWLGVRATSQAHTYLSVRIRSTVSLAGWALTSKKRALLSFTLRWQGACRGLLLDWRAWCFSFSTKFIQFTWQYKRRMELFDFW